MQTDGQLEVTHAGLTGTRPALLPLPLLPRAGAVLAEWIYILDEIHSN